MRIVICNVTAAARFLLERMPMGGSAVYNLADKERFTVRELDGQIRSKLGRAGNSLSLPVPLARVLARAGDFFFRATGRPFPINSARLEALLETTDFSCAKLLATGFEHPEKALTGLVT